MWIALWSNKVQALKKELTSCLHLFSWALLEFIKLEWLGLWALRFPYSSESWAGFLYSKRDGQSRSECEPTSECSEGAGCQGMIWKWGLQLGTWAAQLILENYEWIVHPFWHDYRLDFLEKLVTRLVNQSFYFIQLSLCPLDWLLRCLVKRLGIIRNIFPLGM